MITIKNERLTAVIDPMGAELTSLIDQNGEERLWNGDPAVWKSHAPVLYPFAGGLMNDQYTLRGKTYDMPKHGFAKLRPFRVERCEADTVTFTLDGEYAKHEGFPFENALRVRYTLIGNALNVEYAVDNLDSVPFVYAVGAHEGYACPEGIEQYELVFEKEETLRAQRVVGKLVSHDADLILDHARVLPLREDFFTVDALVFASLNSRKATLRRISDGRSLTVCFPDFGCLLLWQKKGAKYLCIEPWHAVPDYDDFHAEITEKPGAITLEPGQRRVDTHTIIVD